MNLSQLLGIAGFVISLINLIYFFITHRKRLICYFGDYGIQPHIKDTQLLLIHYRIDNASQLPISVTRIRIVLNGSKYDCSTRKLLAEEQSYKKNAECLYEDVSTTDVLPVNLGSLASHSGFLGFVIPQDMKLENDKCLTFEICTNRGKAIQKTFALYEDCQLT